MARDAGRLRDALSPTPLDRLSRLSRPDWTRTTTSRRIAAASLAVLALALAVRGDPGGERVPVVTTTRDLAPGVILGDTDLELTTLPAELVPDGAVRNLADAVGHTLSGPARTGEPITDVRLLGSRLADAVAGPDARIVPLRIEDAEVAGLLRVGDRVDILTVDAEDPHSPDTEVAARPRVLATDATVVLAGSQNTGRPARAPAVLVALPQVSAMTVAAAAMTREITVTLH